MEINGAIVALHHLIYFNKIFTLKFNVLFLEAKPVNLEYVTSINWLSSTLKP